MFESERVELFPFDFDEHFDAMAEMQGNALVMEQVRWRSIARAATPSL